MLRRVDLAGWCWGLGEGLEVGGKICCLNLWRVLWF